MSSLCEERSQFYEMERHVKSTHLHTGIQQNSEHLKTSGRHRSAFHIKTHRSVYLQKTISARHVTFFILSHGYLGSGEQEPKKIAC